MTNDHATRFPKGSAGRPVGAKNKRTILFTECVADQLPAILRQIVAQALDGDKDSQALLFKKYAPHGNLGALIEADTGNKLDSALAGARVIDAMLAGDISVEECGRVLQSLAYYETIVLAGSDREMIDKLFQNDRKL